MSGAPQPDWRSALPTLRCGALTLREPQPSDAASLCCHLSTADVGRLMMQPPDTTAGFQRFVGWARRERAAGRGLCYAIYPRDGSGPVGLLQVRALEPGYGMVEWGFCLGRDYWGTGTFVAAATLLADFLFRHVQVRRLEARVVLPNHRAAGALLKLGAEAEGVLRRGIELHGERIDQTLWAIGRRAWLSRVPEPVGTIAFETETGDASDPAEPRQPRGEWVHQMPVFETPACTLRELVPGDASPLARLLSAPGVTRFLAPPPDGEHGFGQFIVWTHRQRRAARSIVFGVVPAGVAHAVGFFQLHSVAPGFATAEWGFALGEPYWGTGLFGAGAELVLRFVFDTVGVRRLEARAGVDNHRATGALRKMGASPECRLRRSFLMDDEYHDDLLWSLLDDEWRARQAGAPHPSRGPVAHAQAS